MTMSSTMSVYVDDAPAPAICMRPGAYAGNDRLSAIAVDERHVRLSLVGTPDQLTTFAEQLLALAEQLTDEADAYEDALDGEEVAF